MFTLNTMTDEDLGLVSDSTSWFATPSDNSSHQDILEGVYFVRRIELSHTHLTD